MKLHIPTYSSKDLQIMLFTMLPMAVVMNFTIWGTPYFTNLWHFTAATVVSFALLCLSFIVYGIVAVSLRYRFPKEEEVPKRLFITITIFILMSAVVISLVLRGYDYVDFFHYNFFEDDFVKAYLGFVVVNIFLTFLHEGVSRFDKYKVTIKETEQLKKEYMQSQLLGLKSQMNPHFLFNSLNTLSSLINEAPQKGEEFLDHMTKVYRYLLRNNEEQLVSLETELTFLKSYYFLLKARHTEGLQVDFDIPDEYLTCQIPPLTLQMILENALNGNSVSRSSPLVVTITVNDSGLEVRNSLQPKINTLADGEALENIDNKFRLLCQKELIVQNDVKERCIVLPLIPNKAEA